MKTAREQLIQYQNDFKNTKSNILFHIVSVGDSVAKKEGKAEENRYLEEKLEDISTILKLLNHSLFTQKETSAKLEIVDAIDKITKQKELIELLLSEDPIKKQEKQKQIAENFAKKVKSSIK